MGLSSLLVWVICVEIKILIRFMVLEDNLFFLFIKMYLYILQMVTNGSGRVREEEEGAQGQHEWTWCGRHYPETT